MADENDPYRVNNKPVHLKTYCNNCKNYRYFRFDGGWRCSVIVETKDTPTHKVIIHGDYRELNKDNNCKGFKPTLWNRLFGKKEYHNESR